MVSHTELEKQRKTKHKAKPGLGMVYCIKAVDLGQQGEGGDEENLRVLVYDNVKGPKL